MLSSHSDPDNHPVSAFHCLIGAQEALDKILSDDITNALRNLLASYEVASQDYVVQVGFNEELLDKGAGYLEEIYVYLTKEVEGQLSHMLDGLAQLFDPLPCVLFTPEHSYRPPTHPALPLGFDGVILERAKTHHQVLTLTKRGASEPIVNMVATSQERGGGDSDQGGGSAGDGRNSGGNGNDESKSTLPNNNSPGSGGHDNGEAKKSPNDQDDGEPSKKKTQPSVAMTEGRTITPLASCYSKLALFIPTYAVSSNPSPGNPDIHFQEFNMHVEVAVDVCLEVSFRL